MEKQSDPADLSRLKINWENSPALSPENKKRKKFSIGLLIGLILLGGLALLFQPALLGPKEVDVAEVILFNPNLPSVLLNASGYVVAQRQAAVASKGTGRLVELWVKEGDTVLGGDILAKLESADMEAALSRAKANLNIAQSSLQESLAELNEATLDYNRKKNLLETQHIAQAVFDAAEARFKKGEANVASAKAGVKAAEAAVRAAEVDLENTIIRSPFDGTVLTKNAEVGEVVAPFGSSSFAKAAVVTIADMSSLQVEADVSETHIEKVRIGSACDITLDAYPQTKYQGTVATIVPTADRAKATVLTKIRFENRDGRVLPEMSAKVAFLSEPVQSNNPQPFPAVPPGAVLTKGDQKIAFLIQENKVQEVTVQIGESVGSLIEIKNGLKPGDRVVLKPSEGLESGDRIRIRKP